MSEHEEGETQGEDAGPQQFKVQGWVQKPDGAAISLDGQWLAMLDTQSLPSNTYGVDPSIRHRRDEGEVRYA